MHSKVFIAFIALAVAAQACCCCAILGGPQPPYTITPSDEAVRHLEERLNAVETDANGNFGVTVTEEEMTSLMVQMLDEMEEPPPISQLQVHFRNNRVELYMIIHLAESFDLPGMLAFSIDAEGGDIVLTIEEVTVGPLPMPEAITEAMTESLNEAFNEGISGDEAGYVVADVQVGDKEMTIFGQVSR